MNQEFGEDKFTYTFKRDAGQTGRLEAAVNGTMCHSKKESGKYISADWPGFMDKVKAAMAK